MKDVGIDFGVAAFMTLSDGRKILYPKRLNVIRREIKRLASQMSMTKSQRTRSKLHGQMSGLSYEHKSLTKKFLESTVKLLLKNYNDIYVEDINKHELLRTKSPAAGVAAMPWRTFITLLQDYCRRQNRRCILVSPVNTTRKCSNCGNIRDKLPLRMRVYTCQECKLEMDRDQNASRNVLKDGYEAEKTIKRRSI